MGEIDEQELRAERLRTTDGLDLVDLIELARFRELERLDEACPDRRPRLPD